MYSFSYWHTYYDALYLKDNIAPSQTFIKEIQAFPNANIQWNISTILPSLSKIYIALEQYLMTQANWCVCDCDEAEINLIQNSINNLSILLICEKKYARQYWQHDKRRLQASVLHYFILMKNLILSLFPDSINSIQHAVKKKKLCTKMQCLETFINFFLQKLQPIYQFMFSQEFSQEKQLTHQFFNDITYFCKNLPIVNKFKLKQIPKLLRYICLNNTLDVKNYDLLKNNNEIRKKSQTTLKGPRNKVKRKDSLSSVAQSDICDNRDFIKQKFNLDHLNQNEGQNRSLIKNSYFKFNKKLSMRDSYLSSKKKTISTVVKGKSASIDSNSKLRDRSTTFAYPYPLNLSSNKVYKNRKSSNKKDPRRKESQITESDISRNQQRIFYEQKDEEEVQRISKLHKLKTNIQQNNIKINFKSYSEVFSSDSGKPKGWRLIRQYLFKKIASKKIKKYLQL